MRKLTLSLVSVAIFLSQPAHAFHYYFEGGGGVARVTQGSDFFKSSNFTPLTSAIGSTFQLAGLAGLLSPQSSLQIHSGIAHHMVLATNETATYGMQATYGLLRFQFTRFFLTGGYSPLIFRQVPNKGLFDTMGHESLTTSMLAQVGFILPITPQASFTIASTYQKINASGMTGPTLMDVMGVFRFYYGEYEKTKERSGFNDYRYPRGWQRSN